MIIPIIHPFATPHEAALAISMGEIICDECDDVHGWQIQLIFLFWGVAFIWPFDENLTPA